MIHCGKNRPQTRMVKPFRTGTQNPPPQGVPVRFRPRAPQIRPEASTSFRPFSFSLWKVALTSARTCAEVCRNPEVRLGVLFPQVGTNTNQCTLKDTAWVVATLELAPLVAEKSINEQPYAWPPPFVLSGVIRLPMSTTVLRNNDHRLMRCACFCQAYPAYSSLGSS